MSSLIKNYHHVQVHYSKIRVQLTRLETNTVVSVVDIRISDDHIIAPVGIPAVGVLCRILRGACSRNGDVSVSDPLAFVYLRLNFNLIVPFIKY